MEITAGAQHAAFPKQCPALFLGALPFLLAPCPFCWPLAFDALVFEPDKSLQSRLNKNGTSSRNIFEYRSYFQICFNIIMANVTELMEVYVYVLQMSSMQTSGANFFIQRTKFTQILMTFARRSSMRQSAWQETIRYSTSFHTWFLSQLRFYSPLDVLCQNFLRFIEVFDSYFSK